MHIHLVSACQQRALKRSRAVLDSYAIRTGERSWATPITAEGLDELRTLLKRQATRQTAVACYRNDGVSRMKLLWVVGSRKPFGPDGHFPAGYTRRRRPEVPRWLKVLCLLAKAGGLAHDLGKSSEGFQAKLHAAVLGEEPAVAEAARHEWLSMHLLPALLEGADFATAWQALAGNGLTKMGRKGAEYLVNGLHRADDALAFITVSHHRLPGPCDDDGAPDSSNHHVNPALPVNPAGSLDPARLTELATTASRLRDKAGQPSQPELYWRGMALLARAALILADHTVSGQAAEDFGKSYRGQILGEVPNRASADDPGPFDTTARPGALYANTKPDPLPGCRPRYRQTLAWHLREVGARASDLAWCMMNLHLPGLSEEAVERILTPTDPDGPFGWQERAVAAVQRCREQSSQPLLVFNIAATGAGKTRANAKIACCLRQRPRFAVALNLRTLTLQTGDALRRDFGIGADELAVVIGDRTIAKLHAHQRDEAFYGDAEASGEARLYETIGEEVLLPGWMDILTERRQTSRQLLGAPVLVSTVDMLVAAGEPGQQGRHVAALLRLIGSDLILDEVDSYDPQSLVAVLRLVQMAALVGSSVVCSSATLALPVAQAVQRAFASGLAMRRAMRDEADAGRVVVLDHLTTPVSFGVGEDFAGHYQAHLGLLMAAMPATTLRKLQIVPLAGQSMGLLLQAVSTAVQTMHAAQAWTGTGGKQLSFGLVRIANVTQAIRVARYLAQQLPQAWVACYHAKDFLIQRHAKESRLDFLLTRKGATPNAHILADPEIQALLARSPGQSVPFIVVATPVEEIGRDHDFDWAVIEPSSAQSIVQTAGRVNRHRQQPVAAPNIGLLDYNCRWAQSPDVQRYGVFCRPGLEPQSLDKVLRARSKKVYSALQMSLLIDQPEQLGNLDARLRFDSRHPLARDEDRLLTAALKNPLEVLEAQGMSAPSNWMTERFYRAYPLRMRRYELSWRAVRGEDGFWRAERLEKEGRSERAVVQRIGGDFNAPPLANAWLVHDLDHLAALCEAAGIDPLLGLSVQLPEDQTGQNTHYDTSFGFYVHSQSLEDVDD